LVRMMQASVSFGLSCLLSAAGLFQYLFLLFISAQQCKLFDIVIIRIKFFLAVIVSMSFCYFAL